MFTITGLSCWPCFTCIKRHWSNIFFILVFFLFVILYGTDVNSHWYFMFAGYIMMLIIYNYSGIDINTSQYYNDVPTFLITLLRTYIIFFSISVLFGTFTVNIRFFLKFKTMSIRCLNIIKYIKINFYIDYFDHYSYVEKVSVCRGTVLQRASSVVFKFTIAEKQ